jgi:hypothetical protein
MAAKKTKAKKVVKKASKSTVKKTVKKVTKRPAKKTTTVRVAKKKTSLFDQFMNLFK